jgi:hypothetical protein
MLTLVRLATLPLAAAAVLLVNVVSGLAYTTGTTGFDIGYLQCGTAYPAGAFGIVGVDSGWPFISSLHPGNPCLASEYAASPMPGLYVNTGFDPSYTDSNHTTADCATKSGSVSGTPSQQAAWAAGCSEAEKDLAYVAGAGIGTPVGWWLDVETANSWCGQPGTNCTDLSLNQHAIQGLIDTLAANSSAPIGIYSNPSLWGSIVGTLSVSGASADWYASGLRNGKHAATYCGGSSSFSGAPVTLVQYVTSSVDRDYAC